SRPWPHSCRKTAAISPVFEQLELDRKKFSELPFQYALQTWLRFMFAVTFDCNQEFVARIERAFSLIRVRWWKPVREACVLPEPPKPGVAQSVPPLVPNARLPSLLEDSEIEPQVSLMRKYLPFRVVDAVPPV